MLEASTYECLCWCLFTYFSVFFVCVFRPWDQTNLVLNSIEKVKPGSLLSLLCIFPESNGIKFWSHSFHLQNSGNLQTRMDQRGNPMKTNFNIFQIQKWISQTVRAQKVDEKNGVICLVSFFPSWVMVLKSPNIVHFLQICADLSKKSKSIKAIYLYPSKRPYHALSENSRYWGIKYQKKAESPEI